MLHPTRGSRAFCPSFLLAPWGNSISLRSVLAKNQSWKFFLGLESRMKVWANDRASSTIISVRKFVFKLLQQKKRTSRSSSAWGRRLSSWWNPSAPFILLLLTLKATLLTLQVSFFSFRSLFQGGQRRCCLFSGTCTGQLSLFFLLSPCSLSLLSSQIWDSSSSSASLYSYVSLSTRGG